MVPGVKTKPHEPESRLVHLAGREAGRQPPTNWRNIFGGSAWTWCAERGQYYLHTFAPQQPDLNWENPEVRRALYDAALFWLDKGVGGFRIDAIPYIKKPALRAGGYEELLPENEQIFAFLRTMGSHQILTLVNFSLEEAPIPEEIIAGRKLVMDSEENGQKTVLQPLEARIYEIAKQEGSNR